MSINKEISILVIVFMSLAALSCTLLSVSAMNKAAREEMAYMEKLLMEERMHGLSDLVNNAHSVVSSANFYEHAQRALKGMNKVRQKGGGIVAVDGDGMFFVHPDRPELEGLVRPDLADAAGRQYVREILHRSKTEPQGFFRFMDVRPDTGRMAEKLAMFKVHPDWNWVVFSGVFIDDIEAALDLRRREIQAALGRQVRNNVIAALCLLALSILVTTLVLKSRIVKPIAVLTEHAVQSSTGAGGEIPRIKSPRELALLSDSMERMRESLSIAMNRLKIKVGEAKVPSASDTRILEALEKESYARLSDLEERKAEASAGKQLKKGGIS